jgi:transposase
MDRLVLTDAAWERMALLIIGRPDQKGSTGRDNRMFVEGVLWIVRTGSVARSAGSVWRLEQRVPALQPMERQRRLASDFRGDVR